MAVELALPYFRLKSELEKIHLEYKESLNQAQARYTNDLDSLKDQIQETEASRESLQQEVNMLREKIERLRLESMTESEETIGELSRIHEREKLLLIEDNKRLVSEMEKVIKASFLSCECLFIRICGSQSTFQFDYDIFSQHL